MATTAMALVKALEQRLTEQGYIHSWKLVQTCPTRDPALPLHQDDRENFKALLANLGRPQFEHIDIIVNSNHEDRSPEQQLLYQQFINIIGSTSLLPDAHLYDRLGKNRIVEPTSVAFNAREFTQDDERRAHLVREFIDTEESYVNNIGVLVDIFAKPLRGFARDKNQAIIDNYTVKEIFINIEELLAANRTFLADLREVIAEGSERCFGDVCAKNMVNFECYSKFLLGAEESQATNIREQKTNWAYRNYLGKAKDHPDARRQTIQDLLVQPGQRIGRYTMLLEQILRLTPNDHPDFQGLAMALTKAQEIATMADDYHTKSANILFNMHRSIQNCPASIINQNHQLVRHIDATELDLLTRKPLRPVSFFLFTDLLMVAARPTYTSNGLECCGLNDPESGIPSPSPFDTLFARRGGAALQRRAETKMKFKGWIGIEEVEVFEGCVGQTSSFLIRGSAVSNPEPPSPTSPIRGVLGTYFQEQPVRLYAIAPPTDETTSAASVSPTAVQLNAQAYLEQRDEFLAQVYRSKALAKRSEETYVTYHRHWNGIDMYSNLYEFESYYRTEPRMKNDVAVIYVEEDAPDHVENHMVKVPGAPWLIALVQAIEGVGFRFSIKSKVPLETRERKESISGEIQPSGPMVQDFESLFWSNIVACDSKLRSTRTNTLQYDRLNDKMNRRHSAHDRQRSVSRTRTIPTLSKIFGGNGSSPSPYANASPYANGSPYPAFPLPLMEHNTNTPRNGSSGSLNMNYNSANANGTPSTTPHGSGVQVNMHGLDQSVGADHPLYRSPSTATNSTTRTWISSESTSTHDSGGSGGSSTPMSEVDDEVPKKTVTEESAGPVGTRRVSGKVMQMLKGLGNGSPNGIGRPQGKRSLSEGPIVPSSTDVIHEACSNTLQDVSETSERNKQEIDTLKSQIAALKTALTREIEHKVRLGPAPASRTNSPTPGATTPRSRPNSGGFPFGFGQNSGATNGGMPMSNSSLNRSSTNSSIRSTSSRNSSTLSTVSLEEPDTEKSWQKDDFEELNQKVQQMIQHGIPNLSLGGSPAPSIHRRSSFEDDSHIAASAMLSRFSINGLDLLDKLTATMDRMQNEFDDKWMGLTRNYEALADEFEMLEARLQESEKTEWFFRHAYQDASDEIKILYETFNEELEAILDGEQPAQQENEPPSDRPAVPSPEMQLRRRLKHAVRERNMWQQKAGQLERELNLLKHQMSAAGFDVPPANQSFDVQISEEKKSGSPASSQLSLSLEVA